MSVLDLKYSSQMYYQEHVTYLADYVATYETIVNAKRITPTVIRRMCFGDRLYTKTS